jgi:hypothetical protein
MNSHKLIILVVILMWAFWEANAQNTFEKIFGGTGWEVGGYLCKTSDGGYMIGADKGIDLWLIKTNADGDTSWTKTIDLGARESCKYIRQTEDLGYFIAGLQHDTNNYGIMVHFSSKQMRMVHLYGLKIIHFFTFRKAFRHRMVVLLLWEMIISVGPVIL